LKTIKSNERTAQKMDLFARLFAGEDIWQRPAKDEFECDGFMVRDVKVNIQINLEIEELGDDIRYALKYNKLRPQSKRTISTQEYYDNSKTMAAIIGRNYSHEDVKFIDDCDAGLCYFMIYDKYRMDLNNEGDDYVRVSKDIAMALRKYA